MKKRKNKNDVISKYLMRFVFYKMACSLPYVIMFL